MLAVAAVATAVRALHRKPCVVAVPEKKALLLVARVAPEKAVPDGQPVAGQPQGQLGVVGVVRRQQGVMAEAADLVAVEEVAAAEGAECFGFHLGLCPFAGFCRSGSPRQERCAGRPGRA